MAGVKVLANSVPKEIKAGLPKAELLKRLKAWRNYVGALKQDNDSTKYLKDFAKALAQSSFLNHSDPEVKVLVACSLANVLRLYAPDAPYDDRQLQSMFKRFVEELKELRHKDNALFVYRFNLLEDLAVVKSFILCADLGAMDILVSLVHTLLETISPDHSNKVQHYMAYMIGDVIRECEPVPQSIIEALLTCLQKDEKTENPARYALVHSVIAQTQNMVSFQTLLTQYFQSFVDSDGELSDSDFHSKFCYLISEIYHIAPPLLNNVMPLLARDLEGENVGRRVEVNQLLGDLFSDATINAAEDNRSLWLQYLKRLKDINNDVRLMTVKYCQQAIVNHPDLLADVAEPLKQRCLDPAESVRVEAARCILHTAMKNPTSVSADLLDAAAQRMLDKRPTVAVEIVNQVLDLHKTLLLSCAGVAQSDWSLEIQDLFRRYGWMVDQLMKAYKCDDVQIRMSVEIKFESHIVDANESPEVRANQLCAFFVRLADDSYKCVENIIAHKCMLMKHLSNWAHLRIQAESNKNIDNESVIMDELRTLGRMGDPRYLFPILKKANQEITDIKIFKLLLVTADSTNTESQRQKAAGEVLAKLNDNVVRGFQTLFNRMSLAAFQEDMVPFLLAKAQAVYLADKHDAQFGAIVALLLMLGKFLPFYLQSSSVFEQLCGLINHVDPDVAVAGLRLMEEVGENMWSKRDKKAVINVQKRMEELAAGGHKGQAKQAIRALMTIKTNKEAMISSLLRTLFNRLEGSDESLPSTLTALSQLALLSPKSFHSFHKGVITEFIMPDLRHSISATEANSQGESICNASQPLECQVKVLGIKVMVNRLIGLKKLGDKASMDTYGRPIIEILLSIIKDLRHVMDFGVFKDGSASALRRAGARGLVKLMGVPEYYYMAGPLAMCEMTPIVQDPVHHVCTGFTSAVYKLLYNVQLDQSFMALLCFAAVDKSCRDQTHDWCEKIVKQRRALYAQVHAQSHVEAVKRAYQLQPEFVLPQLIFLLAHHDNFTGTDSQLHHAELVIRFYLDVLSTVQKDGENFMFLHALVEFIKETEDAVTPEHSDRLYMLCDLAMSLIITKATQLNKYWKLRPFPTQLRLPSHVFKPKPKGSKRNTQIYLPTSYKFTTSAVKRPFEAVASHPIGEGNNDNVDKDTVKTSNNEKREVAAVKKQRKDVKKRVPKVPAVGERRQASRASRPIQSMKDISGSEESESEEEEIVVQVKPAKANASMATSTPTKTTPQPMSNVQNSTEEGEEEKEDLQDTEVTNAKTSEGMHESGVEVKEEEIRTPELSLTDDVPKTRNERKKRQIEIIETDEEMALDGEEEEEEREEEESTQGRQGGSDKRMVTLANEAKAAKKVPSQPMAKKTKNIAKGPAKISTRTSTRRSTRQH